MLRVKFSQVVTFSTVLVCVMPPALADTSASPPASPSVSSPVSSAQSTSLEQQMALAVARQEIEYLRRQYAQATDMIGRNTPQSIARGRAIYHRIFAPEATITTTENGEIGFSAVGPDAWVDVAAKALAAFANTQHLIGSQVVQIESLPDADGGGGRATMDSYLQAWHDDPDSVLDIFIGTYHDTLRYTPGIGWQIYAMELEKVSGAVTNKR